ncbi:MAG: hypothetical protein AB1451_01380 [Nitrospirota bacterium]
MRWIVMTLVLTTVMLGAGVMAEVGAATLEEIQAPASLPSLDIGPPSTNTPLPSLETGPPSLDTPLPAMDSGAPPVRTPLPSTETAPPAADTPVSPSDSQPAEPAPEPAEEVPPG